MSLWYGRSRKKDPISLEVHGFFVTAHAVPHPRMNDFKKPNLPEHVAYISATAPSLRMHVGPISVIYVYKMNLRSMF